MLTTQTTPDTIPNIMTDWLSVTEAAKKSGYSAYHIRYLCREGTLKTVKKGIMFLIDPVSLEDYVQKMKSLGTYKFDWRRREG